jgi:hypothetical protein
MIVESMGRPLDESRLGVGSAGRDEWLWLELPLSDELGAMCGALRPSCGGGADSARRERGAERERWPSGAAEKARRVDLRSSCLVGCASAVACGSSECVEVARRRSTSTMPVKPPAQLSSAVVSCCAALRLPRRAQPPLDARVGDEGASSESRLRPVRLHVESRDVGRRGVRLQLADSSSGVPGVKGEAEPLVVQPRSAVAYDARRDEARRVVLSDGGREL